MRVCSGLLVLGVAVLLASCADETAQKGKAPAIAMVDGETTLDGEWFVKFDQPYSRRVEGGDLVFWRRGCTLFVSVWPHQHVSAAACLQELRGEISAEAFDVIEESADPVQRLAYRLDEPSKDRRQPAFYGYAVGPKSYVLMAMYFNDPRELAEAKAIWQSLKVREE